MKGWVRRRSRRNCLQNRKRKNDLIGIIMKHFRWSYREDGLLTAVSSNAVECLALQFSVASLQTVFFFLSFGHVFRTELRTSPSLWWNFSSEENRNGECEGSWTMASPARQHEQGIAYTYILLHIYMPESPFVTSHLKAAAFSPPIQINIHLQLAFFLITSHHLLVGLGFGF